MSRSRPAQAAYRFSPCHYEYCMTGSSASVLPSGHPTTIQCRSILVNKSFTCALPGCARHSNENRRAPSSAYHVSVFVLWLGSPAERAPSDGALAYPYRLPVRSNLSMSTSIACRAA